uniref:Uncharacterized protein n=1 Tax=Romanomermis culicivorax TaxID=13658 RepID=A0A915HJ02_ROMCU
MPHVDIDEMLLINRSIFISTDAKRSLTPSTLLTTRDRPSPSANLVHSMIKLADSTEDDDYYQNHTETC